MSDLHLILHGLAIKKHSDADGVARLLGLDRDLVAQSLTAAVKEGSAVEIQGKYMLSPLARITVESDYSRRYGSLRKNAEFMAAYEAFERINLQLKSLITEWQTMEVGGQQVANDHSNKDHDLRLIDRLGNMHESADRILAELSTHLPRLETYRTHLLAALERAEDGAIEWVSDARIDSYHTLWFELHEDLLRIVGREREE